MNKEDIVSQIIRSSEAPAETEDETPTGHFNSGNIMLNVACSGKWNGGFGKGKITNIIGDSFVGKTLQVKTLFAELAYDPAYDDYLLIDDEVERGDGMPIAQMFGAKTAERITAPRATAEGELQGSDTVEDFLDSIYKVIKSGKPFVYALDTFDALTDREEKAIIEHNIKVRDKGREKGTDEDKIKTKESYGTMKVREFNKALRLIKAELQNTESGLIVVSQVRENIGAQMFEPKFKRSGGKALKHYSWHEIWLAKLENIKRGTPPRERVMGAWVQARITKNRTTGKIRTCDFPVLTDYGVDNLEACIDFLTEEKFWSKSGQKIAVPMLRFEGTKAALIQMLDGKERLQRRMFEAVEKGWAEIEESLKLDRQPKYPVGGEVND